MASNWFEPTSAIPTDGWVSSPNIRGTYDIIWSCVQTIFLCAWVSICVNVPAPSHGNLDLLRDKFHFLLLTLLGPELVFLLAFTQFQSAQASVQQFRQAGFADWSLRHAFYADMGGIHVQHPAWKSFPVNAKQLHYLITHGHMKYPEISLREIKARGKTDGLARLLTVGQTLYFLVSTVARASQGLAITTLELSVIGFVFCTLATSICWWNKPSDVETSQVFELSHNIEEVLRQAGDEANEVYRDTPLDFASHQEWSGSNLWVYYVNILRQAGLFRAVHTNRPIQKLSSFNFPKPQSRKSVLVILCLGLVYAGILFGAWEFYFPTKLERLLWRSFSALQCGICFIVGLLEAYYFDEPATVCSPATSPSQSPDVGSGGPIDSEKQTSSKVRRSFWNKPCNNSPGCDRTLNVPLRSLIITTPLCAAYCICRWYLLLEDFVGLRSIPSSAYQTVDWTSYWPSF